MLDANDVLQTELAVMDATIRWCFWFVQSSGRRCVRLA